MFLKTLSKFKTWGGEREKFGREGQYQPPTLFGWRITRHVSTA